MERFLFESLMTNEKQIQKLEHSLDSISEVQTWEIKRIANGIVLIIEGVRIQAFELVRTLGNYGYVIERVYEE